MTSEKHYRLGKKFSVRIRKLKGGTYEYSVYPNGHPQMFLASGEDLTIHAAKKHAKQGLVYTLKRMRKRGSGQGELVRYMVGGRLRGRLREPKASK